MTRFCTRLAPWALAGALCVSLSAYTPYHVAQRLSPNLAWHSTDKETHVTLSSIQIGKSKMLAIQVSFPAGSAAEALSDIIETKNWQHAGGVGLFLGPDGTSRYVDFGLVDAQSGEAFRCGLLARDPSCHQVFVPFALFSSGNSAFKPAEHLRVRLTWHCPKELEAPLAFKAGGFSVGSLDEGESAWPASTRPVTEAPVYLETFESAPGCQPAGMASFASLMMGPPKTNISRSLAIHLVSAASLCQWDFLDISRWGYFDGMTIWLKTDAPNSGIELVILAKNARGERRFVHDIPVQGRDWGARHAGWGDFADPEGHGFAPGEFRTASLILRAPFGAVYPVDVSVGPFRLDDK